MSLRLLPTGGLFPTGSHEYEVFRFALAQHQDIPKLVPQVDMVDTASSFSMTYACKFTWVELFEYSLWQQMLRLHFMQQLCDNQNCRYWAV